MFKLFNKNKENTVDKKIKKNCNILIKKGLPVNLNMESVLNNANIRIRSKEEIIKEMIDEFVLAHHALLLLNKTIDQDLPNYINKFKPSNKVIETLYKTYNLENERDIITLNAQTNMYYRVEVYLYVLGIKIRPEQDKMCYIQSIEYNFQSFKDSNDILNKSKMIKNEELLEFIDLIDRYMYAYNELLNNNKTSDRVNWHAIMEQKVANDFIIFKNN